MTGSKNVSVIQAHSDVQTLGLVELRLLFAANNIFILFEETQVSSETINDEKVKREDDVNTQFAHFTYIHNRKNNTRLEFYMLIYIKHASFLGVFENLTQQIWLINWIDR